MFGRSPSPPRRFGASAFVAVVACFVVFGCRGEMTVTPEDSDGGPCGRGKARSCQCDDGRNGIAQCLVGGDWGECYCGDDALQDGSSNGKPDAGLRRDAGLLGPIDTDASFPCDVPFDLRAHAPTDVLSPYMVPASMALSGAPSDTGVCFYFKKFPDKFASIGFQALADEINRPDYWLLWGVASSAHADGDVVPCSSAETSAYLLAGFSPASRDIAVPSDVALGLPAQPDGALILEVHYANSSPVELLDRTGVRVCGDASAREHAAAVHVTGSDALCVPGNATDYQISGTCSPRTDLGSIHLMSIRPRMLRFGKRMQVQIKRVSGAVDTIYDDLVVSPLQTSALQGDVTLEPGDSLVTNCFYDNPNLLAAPMGVDAADALCYAYITAWPAGALEAPSSPTFNPFAPSPPPNRCIAQPGLLPACF